MINLIIMLFALNANATGKVTIKVLTKEEAYVACIVRLTRSVKPKTPHQAMLIVDKCQKGIK